MVSQRPATHASCPSAKFRGLLYRGLPSFEWQKDALPEAIYGVSAFKSAGVDASRPGPAIGTIESSRYELMVTFGRRTLSPWYCFPKIHHPDWIQKSEERLQSCRVSCVQMWYKPGNGASFSSTLDLIMEGRIYSNRTYSA